MASQSDVVQKQKAAPKKDAVQVISRAGTEDALVEVIQYPVCLLYTSDAADDL